MRTAWKKGPAFAEFAEALAIATDQIIAVQLHPSGDVAVVMFSDELTPNVYTKPTVFRQVLVRDGEGILRSDDEPVEMPGFWQQVERQLGLDDDEGDPED